MECNASRSHDGIIYNAPEEGRIKIRYTNECIGRFRVGPNLLKICDDKPRAQTATQARMHYLTQRECWSDIKSNTIRWQTLTCHGRRRSSLCTTISAECGSRVTIASSSRRNREPPMKRETSQCRLRQTKSGSLRTLCTSSYVRMSLR